MNNNKISAGKPLPLGACPDEKGVNFSLYSKNAQSVSLIIFYDNQDYGEVKLDPKKNRTGDIWHIYVHGLKTGQRYGYLLDGPYDPESGLKFNKNKLVIDPYAKNIEGDLHFERNELYSFDKKSESHDLSFNDQSNIEVAPRSIVTSETQYSGLGYIPSPNYHLSEMVVYEVHLRGYTKSPTSAVKYPGTYLRFIEKLDYLKSLGITSIELMPVQEFNPKELIRKNPTTGEMLSQYWGYNTINFFTPARYFSARENEQVEEFKEMVSECHKRGLEVILDVVYNHTGEGGVDGPTLSFRGIDNQAYYMLEENKRFYKNYSGCGNTFNCNFPIVKQLIIDSLRYWFLEMNVDGFRFDLAAILGRNPQGDWVGENSIINEILNDPLLSGCKLIAEGWDAGGLYQLGQFPSGWAEWNGKYRDSVRRFFRGDDGTIHNFLDAFIGSPGLYGHYKSPDHSINFITCHDGFTLRDLVSYNEKHNFENAEDNRDGSNDNHSCNWGNEGETNDPDIIKLRKKMVKNFLCTLFLSQGLPMIYAGDETYRTQRGNNNAYCHDTQWNWFNWEDTVQHKDILNFTKQMIRFRKEHPTLRKKNYFVNRKLELDSVSDIWNHDITYHGTKLNEADLSHFSHTIAFLINGIAEFNNLEKSVPPLFIIFNSYHKELIFEIPTLNQQNEQWIKVIDTHHNHPFEKLPVQEEIITAAAHSIIVLESGKVK